jgi:hypothetical protein
MNTAQRIILIVYCVLLLYCCLWIPWHIHVYASDYRHFPDQRVGYGWLWAGPISGWNARYATPDIPLILLRILAVTAIAGIALLITQIVAKNRQPK